MEDVTAGAAVPPTPPAIAPAHPPGAGAAALIRTGTCGGLVWPSLLRPWLTSPTPALALATPGRPPPRLEIGPDGPLTYFVPPATVRAWTDAAGGRTEPPPSPDTAAALGAAADAAAAAFLDAHPGTPPIPRDLLRAQLLEEAVSAPQTRPRLPVAALAAVADAATGHCWAALPAGEGGDAVRLACLTGVAMHEADGAADGGWASASTGSWSSDGESGDSDEDEDRGGRPPAWPPATLIALAGEAVLPGPGPALTHLALEQGGGHHRLTLGAGGGHWAALVSLATTDDSAGAHPQPTGAAALHTAEVVTGVAPLPGGGGDALRGAAVTADGAVWEVVGERGGGGGLAPPLRPTPSRAAFSPAATRLIAGPDTDRPPPGTTHFVWTPRLPGCGLAAAGGRAWLVDARLPPRAARAARLLQAGDGGGAATTLSWPVTALAAAPRTATGAAAHTGALATPADVALFDVRAPGRPLAAWEVGGPGWPPGGGGGAAAADGLAIVAGRAGAVAVLASLAAAGGRVVECWAEAGAGYRRRGAGGAAAAAQPPPPTLALTARRAAAADPRSTRLFALAGVTPGKADPAAVAAAGEQGGRRPFAWRPVAAAACPRAARPAAWADGLPGGRGLPPCIGVAVGRGVLLRADAAGGLWAQALAAGAAPAKPLPPSLDAAKAAWGSAPPPAAANAPARPPPVTDVAATAECAVAAVAVWRASRPPAEETGWGPAGLAGAAAAAAAPGGRGRGRGGPPRHLPRPHPLPARHRRPAGQAEPVRPPPREVRWAAAARELAARRAAWRSGGGGGDPAAAVAAVAGTAFPAVVVGAPGQAAALPSATAVVMPHGPPPPAPEGVDVEAGGVGTAMPALSEGAAGVLRALEEAWE